MCAKSRGEVRARGAMKWGGHQRRTFTETLQTPRESGRSHVGSSQKLKQTRISSTRSLRPWQQRHVATRRKFSTRPANASRLIHKFRREVTERDEFKQCMHPTDSPMLYPTGARVRIPVHRPQIRTSTPRTPRTATTGRHAAPAVSLDSADTFAGPRRNARSPNYRPHWRYTRHALKAVASVALAANESTSRVTSS